MKIGWQTKRLGEIYSFKNGINFDKTQKIGRGILTIDVLNMYGDDLEVKLNNLYRVNKDVSGEYILKDSDILVVRSSVKREGVGWAALFRETSEPITFCGFIIRCRPIVEIQPEYTVYFLRCGLIRDELIRRATQSTITNINQFNLGELIVPLPPLPEQQRIVGILDEAFDDIAIAKANAEKNLKNARALFESHLQSVFTQRGKGWISLPFEDCIEDVKYTTKIQRKDFLEEGVYPIVSQEAEFTNGYWDNEADIFKITRPVVIFGDHTKVLKYVDFDFVLGADGVKILPPKQFLIPKYFFYHLRSIPLKSLGYSRHYRLLKEVEISYPQRIEQTAIIKRLDELEAETQRLESIYQQKLTALEALKKALLHQAFTGAL